jgi:hypothetical protein
LKKALRAKPQSTVAIPARFGDERGHCCGRRDRHE